MSLLWLAFAVVAPALDLPQAVAIAQQQGQSHYRIPPGAYHLTKPARARACVALSRLNDFTIEAEGVELICSDRTSSVLLFDHCANVTVHGLHLRHDPIPFSQGRVMAIAADNQSLDVEIASGYPADLGNARFFPVHGFLGVFDVQTRRWKRGAVDLFYFGAERLGERAFRFRFRSPVVRARGAAVGDLVAWRGVVEPDIKLEGCARMHLVDLAITDAAGFVVHEDGGEGGNFYRYSVSRGSVPAGATEAPLLSANADAFHSSNVRHGPTLDHCEFALMDDDGIAIHGTYAAMAGLTPAGAVVLASSRPEFCQAGDRLRFYDPDGNYQGDGRVTASRPAADFHPANSDYRTGKRLFADERSLHFEQVAFEPLKKLEPGWWVSDRDAIGSGFAVQHCVIRDNRARGILIKASDGIIEDNLIERTTMAGIALWPELGTWSESEFAANVLIRRNVLRDVALWNEPWNPMAGAISVGAFEAGHFVSADHTSRDLRIEANRFERNRGINILIASAENVSLRGNHFIDPQPQGAERGKSLGLDPHQLIERIHATGITASGNVLEVNGRSSALEVERDLRAR